MLRHNPRNNYPTQPWESGVSLPYVRADVELGPHRHSPSVRDAEEEEEHTSQMASSACEPNDQGMERRIVSCSDNPGSTHSPLVLQAYLNTHCFEAPFTILSGYAIN